MPGRLIDAGHPLGLYDTSDARRSPLAERDATRAPLGGGGRWTVAAAVTSLPTPEIAKVIEEWAGVAIRGWAQSGIPG